MSRNSKVNRNFRPTALLEAMEPRRMLSGTGFSALSGINVDQGMYTPGHRFGAQVMTSPWQGLDGLPVKLALSKDTVVGDNDDIPLGTANVTTTSWPGVGYTFSSANFNVTLPDKLKAGTYHVVAQSDDGSTVVGPSITVEVPRAGTDLEIVDGSMYHWLIPSWPGRANVTVRNAGTVASGPWKMSVYLSKDKVLGNGDDILMGTGTPTMGDPALGPADTGYFSLEFDHQSLPDGVYYPIIVIDSQNQVAETDETNNVVVADPMIVAPGVAETGLVSVTAASRTDAGSTLAVDVTTDPAQAHGSRDLYFQLLAADGTAYRLGGGLTLPAADGHVDLAVPADVPAGQYQLRTMVDIDGQPYMVQVEDQDPAAVGPTVWVGMDPTPVTPDTPETPDTPTAPEVEPVEMPAGSGGQVPLVVANDQTHAVRRKYNVAFYLSDDATLSGGDRKFSQTHVAASVAAGQSKALLASYRLPKGAHLGTQYLIAVANPVGGQAAGSPSAKALRAAGAAAGRVQLVVPVSVVGPKLAAVVRSVRPVQGRPGMERLTVRLTNTGPATFSDAVTLRVLTDADSPETLLAAKRVLNLKAGKHVDVTLTVAKPAAAAGLRVVVS